jgi:hypothetical protein
MATSLKMWVSWEAIPLFQERGSLKLSEWNCNYNFFEKNLESLKSNANLLLREF